MTIKFLNNFVNKSVCMHDHGMEHRRQFDACYEGFFVEAMILFCFKFLKDSMNFDRFLQTPDLEITTQFSLHLTKTMFLLETIRNLKQRTVNDFMSLFYIFIRILLHHSKPKKKSPEVFYKNGVLKNFADFTEKPLGWYLQHKFFPVNFSKFLKTSF